MKTVKTSYPAFDQPEIYFSVGCLNSGENRESGKILIGAEMAAGNTVVDASALSEWLRRLFRLNNDVIFLKINDMIHAKQKNQGKAHNLLEACIHEGAADFIAEQVLGYEIRTPYISYGLAHEEELWKNFKKEMYEKETKKWLYNDASPVANPGYFIGYMICRAWYAFSKEKTKAIAAILNLKFGDRKMLNELLVKSKYAYKINHRL